MDRFVRVVADTSKPFLRLQSSMYGRSDWSEYVTDEGLVLDGGMFAQTLPLVNDGSFKFVRIPLIEFTNEELWSYGWSKDLDWDRVTVEESQ